LNKNIKESIRKSINVNIQEKRKNKNNYMKEVIILEVRGNKSQLILGKEKNNLILND